jgi:hypothetical protein
MTTKKTDRKPPRTLSNGAQLFDDHANAVERLLLSGWTKQDSQVWLRIRDQRVECVKLTRLSDGRGVLLTRPGLDIPATSI